MRQGTVKLIETYCQAEKLAKDVLDLAQGHRRETQTHKRLLVAYRMLMGAAAELRLAEKDL
jgi:hypothetical protein